MSPFARIALAGALFAPALAHAECRVVCPPETLACETRCYGAPSAPGPAHNAYSRSYLAYPMSQTPQQQQQLVPWWNQLPR